MHTLLQDLRFSLRLIRRSPMSSAVIVLTLALGILANVTMFAGFDAWVLRELDFPEPDRLAAIFGSQPQLDRRRAGDSAPDLREWRQQQTSFERLGAFRRAVFNFNDERDPARVDGARVSADLFPLLGVEPSQGRLFAPGEDDPGSGADRVLVSDLFWREHLHADPAVIGRTIRIDGDLREVVGVMPPGFQFPEWADLWLPLVLDPAVEQRGARRLSVAGRLAEGVSLEQARAEMEEISRRLALQHPETNRGWGTEVLPLRAAWVPPVIETALTASLAAAFCVLVIICANVAGLLLAQATARKRETALRSALGASRGRLIRQWLTECTLLALAAGAVGVALGDASVEWMKSWAPVQVPYLFQFEFDARALAYTLAVSLAAGLVCALAPVFRHSGADVYPALKGQGTESASGSWGRSVLVVGQFGLAMALLIGALLMVRSFLNQQSIDPGFPAGGLLTLELATSGEEYREQDARLDVVNRLVDRLGTLPGVSAAAAVSRLPIGDGYEVVTLEPEGWNRPPEERERGTLQGVTAEYFETLELPVRTGRAFTVQESRRGADVALVSETLGRRLWPGADPLGRRLRVSDAGGAWLTVVGVVGDVDTGHHMVSFGGLPDKAQFYVPMASSESGQVHLLLRESMPAAALAPRIRDVVRETAPGLPVSQILGMREVIDREQWVLRMFSRSFVLYAAIALAIAALGVYGLTADAVSRRLREMAVRRALGATPRDLLRLIGRQGLGLAALGGLLGGTLALLTTRFGASMLYGVSARDPLIFVGVAVLMLLVAALASLLPARRLLRSDLTRALRTE